MIYLAVFLFFEESSATIGNPSGIIRLYGSIHGNNIAFEKKGLQQKTLEITSIMDIFGYFKDSAAPNYGKSQWTQV